MLRYRIALALAALPLALSLLAARLRGRLSARDLAERLGGGQAGDAGKLHRGPRLWLHGASLGELAAARKLAETALSRDPALRLIVTANSVTGRDAVRGWGHARIEARLAPLDYGAPLTAFLGRWQPEGLITVETEIWPNRFRACARRGIPVALVGARLSETSARRLRWLGRRGLARLCAAISYLAAQDEASEARFRALGVAPSAIGPRLLLKGGAGAPPADEAELARLARALPRATTVLAASTHEGEEEIVLEAFRRARADLPALHLVLAPRHPERGDAVARAIEAAGLAVARRSQGDPPRADAVYLADTLGEMGLWYRLAGITFLGGSLVPRGGHTPFEPVACGTALLHGPHIANNAAAFAALARGGGALPVSGAGDLSAAIVALARQPERAEQMAEAGARALAPLRRDDAGADAFWSRFAALTNLPALG